MFEKSIILKIKLYIEKSARPGPFSIFFTEKDVFISFTGDVASGRIKKPILFKEPPFLWVWGTIVFYSVRLDILLSNFK